jgi:hypothetical protein
MLLDALFHCRKGSTGLPLKNVKYMPEITLVVDTI